MSPQRAWQDRQVKLGLCLLCSNPAEQGRKLCAAHREARKITARNKYRTAHGIPLDAPVRQPLT